MNFAKFLSTFFLQNTSGRLLLPFFQAFLVMLRLIVRVRVMPKSEIFKSLKCSSGEMDFKVGGHETLESIFGNHGCSHQGQNVTVLAMVAQQPWLTDKKSF